ncbi:hypothetical protein SAMN05444392_1117 [Seinonella peptonophila]|uniref:Nudix hydrolase domain-containing protein n=1 Tax=Seinonella peptonophila TaxID=112248 RepID=A0A1M4ZVY9_9BACL|nr:NUDIX hydrolase [Seinonella peptonophila]SHF22155.1 hypothetical protein SAMN05444392_1117 [Seinonella peptonophila]
MSITSVSENVIANIIALMIIGFTTYFFIYIRMSGISQSFRRLRPPKKRVFYLDQIQITDVVRDEHTDFISPITHKEREILIKFYASRNQARLFNGRSVRLDQLIFTSNHKEDHNLNQLDPPRSLVKAKISQVDFFDFISTNLTAYPSNEPVRSFRQQLAAVFRSIGSFAIIQQVTNDVKKHGRPKDVLDALNNRSLANIIAVSILIIDTQGRIGIVKRTTRVAISSGNYGTTCAGTVGSDDYSETDPFITCAIREIKEELNLEFTSLNFDGIAVPKQKMQPIFLYHVHTDKTWEELFPIIQEARDFSFETAAFYAVPIDQAITFVAHSKMTDTAAFQIWHFARLNGYEKNWFSALLSLPKRNEYLLPWRGCCQQSQSISILPGTKKSELKS